MCLRVDFGGFNISCYFIQESSDQQTNIGLTKHLT